jgi:hypothetical protein
MEARMTSRMVPKTTPALLKALGSVKAPTPMIRLKTYTNANWNIEKGSKPVRLGQFLPMPQAEKVAIHADFQMQLLLDDLYFCTWATNLQHSVLKTEQHA